MRLMVLILPFTLLWGRASLAQGSTEFCANPRKSICESPLPQKMDVPALSTVIIRSKLNTPSEEIFSKDPDLNKSLRTSKILSEQMARLGISHKQLLDKLSDIKRITADNFTYGRMGPSQYERGPLSNAELGKKIKSVEIITPLAMEKIFSNPAVKKAYFNLCGPEGLANNATYIASINSVIICPGNMINTLNSQKLGDLDFVIAHELTHALGPMGNYVVGNKTYSTLPKFAAFSSCIQANHAHRLEDYRKIQNHFSAQIMQIQNYANLPQANPSVAAANRKDAQEKVQKLKDGLAYITYHQKLIKAELGHEPSIAEMHGEELVADVGAYLTMTEILKSTPKEKRTELVTSNLRRFCVSDKLTGSFSGFSGDGTHPASSFRIDMFFNNPEVASLLGCAKIGNAEAWCSPKTEAPHLPANKTPAGKLPATN